MIPIFVALFLVPMFVPIIGFHFAALGVFILACLTDMLDGYVARKYNQITDLGKFLDPIADKILVMAALTMIVVTSVSGFGLDFGTYLQLAIVSVIVVCAILILARELFIGGFRLVAISKNIKIAADKLGKIKTIFQMVALIFLIPLVDIARLLIPSVLPPIFFPRVGFIFDFLLFDIFFIIGFVALIIATLLTVISGISYMLKNKGVLSTNNESKTIVADALIVPTKQVDSPNSEEKNSEN